MTTPTARRLVGATRERVWDVIADGWCYSQWVVGNSRMRAVEESWPAPGSVIEHSVGVWPLVVNDRTEVQECRPHEELVLLARLGPIGAARVRLRLTDTPDGGCRIEMTETPVTGPMALLPDRVAQLAVYPRNRECLWRLAALAERRQSDAPDASDASDASV